MLSLTFLCFCSTKFSSVYMGIGILVSNAVTVIQLLSHVWLLYTFAKGALFYPQKLHFQYVLNAHPKFSCIVRKQISWAIVYHTFC